MEVYCVEGPVILCSIQRAVRCCLTAFVCLLTVFAAAALGNETVDVDLDETAATGIADSFLPAVLTGTAAGLYFLEDDHKAADQFAQVMGTTAAVTGLLKVGTGLSRPDGSPDGFPSGHTSAAFAWASFMADRHPKNKWFYYGAAGAVGWTRVELNRHYPYQVVAGAVLGRLVADHCTDDNKRSRILDKLFFEAAPNGRDVSTDFTTRVTLRKLSW